MGKTYLDKYLRWMLEKGRTERQGIEPRYYQPKEPLSDYSARIFLTNTRKMLIEMGYVERILITGRRYEYFTRSRKYPDLKDVRSLSIKDVTEWFSKEFPHPKERKERQRKSFYVFSIWKFGEFLHFELRIWSKSKLLRLKTEVRPLSYGAPDIEIIKPERIDQFLTFIKKKKIMHYMMFYMMRHLNMRWVEIINARADLKSGSFIPKWSQNKAIIWGKGPGGLGKKGVVPFLDYVQKEIKEYLQWRKDNGIESEWLFTTEHSNYKRKWQDHPGGFNTVIRNLGREFGLTEEELKLCSTHKIGRHVYGTVQAMGKLPRKLAKLNMRVEDGKVLERYENIDFEGRLKMTEEALNNKNNAQDHQPSNSDNIFKQLLSLSPDEKAKLKELLA